MKKAHEDFAEFFKDIVFLYLFQSRCLAKIYVVSVSASINTESGNDRFATFKTNVKGD